MIIPLYKGKRERIEYKDFRSVNFQCVVGKIYAGIRVHRLMEVWRSNLHSEAIR